MEKPVENIVLKLSFEFAVEIIKYSDFLHDNKKFVLSNQLLKSGTSIGANIKEAQGAESKADFIHKLKIAYKEAEETEYWLLLIKQAYNYPELEKLLESLISIKKLLSRIITTSKSHLHKR